MSYQPAPHLCGTIRGASDACPYLMITGREPVRDLLTGRTLQPYAVYCIREGKIRKLGNKIDWTGLTPKSCPRRIAWEETNSSPAERVELERSAVGSREVCGLPETEKGTGGSDEEAEHGDGN